MITWTQVTDLAPELSTVPLVVQTSILAQVSLLVGESSWGTAYTQAAVCLAAHFGALSVRSGDESPGPVSQESLDQASKSYAVTREMTETPYGSTVYGQRYQSLLGLLQFKRFGLAIA